MRTVMKLFQKAGRIGCSLTCWLGLAGCARYSDFHLPPPFGVTVVQAFRWAPYPDPVLKRGSSGEWDSADVLNPSVVKYQGMYFNFYSGFDGKTWHTGLATSANGVVWVKQGKVLSPDPRTWEGDYIAANGSAMFVGGRFLYWYQAGTPPHIGLAQSSDGKRWAKRPQPVLNPGPRGSWDERGVADPYVLQIGGTFYMYYLGQDRARRQRLGLARSADGMRWQKLRSNPVLELGGPSAFDENGLGEPAVWEYGGSYWMLYTGRDTHENRRIGLARSKDGVRWQKLPAHFVFFGNQPWDAPTVCDPTVLIEGNMVRVWFGGGDLARPAENLHGQIGLARLEPVEGHW